MCVENSYILQSTIELMMVRTSDRVLDAGSGSTIIGISKQPEFLK